MKIHKLISEVQSKLKAPKEQNNTFGKYKYRSTEDIVEAVKPILKEYNLYLNITDDIIDVNGSVFIRATASIADDEGNFISAQGLAKHANSQSGMSDAQITGSTSSYARKYALNGLLAIDDTKDDDFSNTHGKDTSKVVATPQQRVVPTPIKLDERKQKALTAFKKLDGAKVIKYLTTNKLMYASVEDFIAKESIEKVLEVYDKVSK